MKLYIPMRRLAAALALTASVLALSGPAEAATPDTTYCAADAETRVQAAVGATVLGVLAASTEGLESDAYLIAYYAELTVATLPVCPTA